MGEREREKWIKEIHVCMHGCEYLRFIFHKMRKKQEYYTRFFYIYSHLNETRVYICIYLYTCRSLDLRSTKDLFMMSFVEKKIGNIYYTYFSKVSCKWVRERRVIEKEKKVKIIIYWFISHINRLLFIFFS